MVGLYDDRMVSELLAGAQSPVGEWGLSENTEVSLVTVSENATFKAYDPTQDKQIILRVHRPGYHTRMEIESELAWIRDLRKQSVVDTPEPIQKRGGGLIASFRTEHEERGIPGTVYLIEDILNLHSTLD